MYRAAIIDRFWAKVARGAEDECWEYGGAISSTNGYGSFAITTSKSINAHRFAYEATFGPIAAGLCVCHRCDNRKCCNPGHFFLGTRADNRADCVAKQRHAKGERNAGAKLTEREVRLIRRALASGDWMQRTLARQYGISESQMSNIANRRQWAGVE
jgi:hypothetical protein